MSDAIAPTVLPLLVVASMMPYRLPVKSACSCFAYNRWPGPF